MTVNKRKKSSRMHGSKTHGYGSMKKHRGHGHRGGSGMGGTGKKGDAKKPSIWKNEKYFGRHGFVPKTGIELNSVTVQFLDENAERLSKSGKEPFEIDISTFGKNKVIGTGKVKRKLAIKADYFSATAAKKIEAAGGEIVSVNKAAAE